MPDYLCILYLKNTKNNNNKKQRFLIRFLYLSRNYSTDNIVCNFVNFMSKLCSMQDVFLCILFINQHTIMVCSQSVLSTRNHKGKHLRSRVIFVSTSYAIYILFFNFNCENLCLWTKYHVGFVDHGLYINYFSMVRLFRVPLNYKYNLECCPKCTMSKYN